MVRYGIIAHGGAGTSEDFVEGVKTAVETGFSMLKNGARALKAAVEAVRILEDDGRYNAGSGSLLRLDGHTIEMDAAVMDSAGTLGTVSAIRCVKNPVLVALGVSKSPHVMLAGQGAEAFARHLGFPSFYHVSSRALDSFNQLRELVRSGRLEKMNPRWKNVGLPALALDTVGAVALDRRGKFAVATSTGGASPMIAGRVGDTPVIGCGFYAGNSGAVCATGLGEKIIRQMLAWRVYDMMGTGSNPVTACEKGVGLFPDDIPVGIIGLSREGYSAASNRKMVRYALLKED